MSRYICRHFEELVGGCLLLLMCLIGVIKVFARYVMTSPLAWTEELATILFAWLVFVGASLALKRKEHFAIELFVEMLPRRLRHLADHLQRIATVLFCLLLIYYGAKLVVTTWTVRTPLLDVSRAWLYASVMCGGILMLVRTVEAYLGHVQPMPTLEPGSAKEVRE